MKQEALTTLISGTNRTQSNTLAFSSILLKWLGEQSVSTPLFLDLQALESWKVSNAMFAKAGQDPIISDLQDRFVIPADRFIIVVPEYNGSFPGIIKYFIDAVSVRRYEDNFMNKRAMLIGISTGRAGNLRGMSHLTGILNYLQVHVHPFQLPVSRVQEVIDPVNGRFTDPELEMHLTNHLVPFLSAPLAEPSTPGL